jgi:MFS transporter, DHA3 family, tetracycline resistance protein
MALVVLMAGTSAFIVVIAAYLVVATLRPVFSPLVTGWVVGRVDSSVCATALSATDLLDSAGQIAGGPIVGAIGVLASVRAALLAGAAALAPAAALLAAAARRAGQVSQQGGGDLAGLGDAGHVGAAADHPEAGTADG